MARTIVTLLIFPESPDIDLKPIELLSVEAIKKFSGDSERKIEKEPIAFGLTALKITFIMEESIGSTEPLEEAIKQIEGVASVEVTDVRRTIG